MDPGAQKPGSAGSDVQGQQGLIQNKKKENLKPHLRERKCHRKIQNGVASHTEKSLDCAALSTMILRLQATETLNNKSIWTEEVALSLEPKLQDQSSIPRSHIKSPACTGWKGGSAVKGTG